MEKTQNSKKFVRYPLAPAARRIFAKVIDIIILAIIVFCLGLAIYCTDPGFKWGSDFKITQTWRYGVYTFIVGLVFFLGMLLLPYFWKKTIGMRLFKLGYYNTLPLSNYMFNLFKHELFVWELIIILNLIIGIVLTCSSPDNAKNLLDGIMVYKTATNAYYYVGVGFATAYLVLMLVLIGIIIAICVRNKNLHSMINTAIYMYYI